ncbi:MAG: hypothetical protein M0R47_16670 [Methylobacter sp.]|uniref:hypothetical protein n=1 Tax=Methylobacter sp. TaxID=2051955 RepID=UPI0025DF3DD9|nr:hypothetical protein [Methylobacter sp.]MCK9622156.1 hypothetical protein [Methylobacter sp.]
MSIDVILDCPDEKLCEHVDRKGKLHRCRAYMAIEGRHPTTGAETKDWKCAKYEWQPILLLEIARTNRGTSDAVVSMREETIKRQDQFIGLAFEARQERLLGGD